jgi:hypothetical protein
VRNNSAAVQQERGRMRLYVYSGYLNLAAMFLRRVRINSRSYATAPNRASKVVTPPLHAAKKTRKIKFSLRCVSPKPARSRALLASVLAKALWLKDRFASDVSGSDLSYIMTRRILFVRECAKVLQSFSSRASVSTKRATWGRLGLAGAC